MLMSDSEGARLENCPASKMYHALSHVAGLLTCLLSRCLSVCRGYLTFINILGPLVRNWLRGFRANVVFLDIIYLVDAGDKQLGGVLACVDAPVP